jgi:hypothetical protein
MIQKFNILTGGNIILDGLEVLIRILALGPTLK